MRARNIFASVTFYLFVTHFFVNQDRMRRLHGRHWLLSDGVLHGRLGVATEFFENPESQ